MALHDIEIMTMTRVPEPKRNVRGDSILAFLDLRIGVIVLEGCALIQRETGYVTIWPPRLAKFHSNRGIRIVDHAAKLQLIKAARAAFDAMKTQSK